MPDALRPEPYGAGLRWHPREHEYQAMTADLSAIISV